jgi:hypothetical protein
MDFSYLKKLEVKDRTARYDMFQISSEPVLIVRPATEANKPYFNAVLRKSRKNSRALRAGAINRAMITENREQDRELFPRYVIVGWENVVDVNGESVEFSPDNCRGFLDALPDWIFDDVRNFAGDSANFVDELPDAETMAGN